MLTSARLRWAAVLGFALGGFFDGILLHQILQWHHLLSLVPGVDSLRLQVLWDGWFHALMYLIAAAGLWGLWRSRGTCEPVSGAVLAGAVLLGFGLWHAVDAVLSHWVLGIHRVRLDSADPLLWDIGWLAAFGLVPVLAGWRLLRGGGPPLGRSGSLAALALLAPLAAGAAAWSAWPQPERRFTTIVFAPGIAPGEAINAVVAQSGALVWSDPAGGVLVAEVPRERRLGLYRRGALLVSGSGVPAGCLDWSSV
jgi:uncharacterized membrane protein